MAKPYRECPACAYRALSIATRCPRCGQELASEPVRRQRSRDTGRLGTAVTTAAILLIAGGLVTLTLRRSAGRDPDAAATAGLGTEAPVAVETAGAAASPPLPDSAPSAEAVPRQARTWTRVHDRRSTKADVVAVLLPGDSVLVDSLRGGWWRVALEGRIVGYVYGRTLVGE
jgi:hypothetical protein